MTDSRRTLFLAFAAGCAICIAVGLVGGKWRRDKLVEQVQAYPNTGYVAPIGSVEGSESPIQQAAHYGSTRAPLFDLAYEDTIHDDEDLLLPGSSPSQTPTTSPSQPEPILSEPKDALPILVEQQSPPPTQKPMPSVERIEPQTVQPQTSEQRLPTVESQVAPSSDSNHRFDPNRGPAPDEDLLLPDEPADSTKNPNASSPQRKTPTVTAPRQSTPPMQRPDSIVAPQPDTATKAPPTVNVPPKRQQPIIEVLPNSPVTTPSDVIPNHTSSLQEPRTLPHMPAPHSTSARSPTERYSGPDPHLEVFAKSTFPSAKECRSCHESIYEEWASSSHAYASMSPMFQKFEQAINVLAKGTIGYFCLRCHSPVATALGHERHLSIYDSIPSATEGVTCVACHRVKEEYGKVNGERRIEPGSINDPVYGTGYGEGLAEVLAKKDHYKVKTGPHETGPGEQIHNRVIHFEQLSSSHFCVSCHQVVVYPGIALEVVWAQYRASPAHQQGIECQDCHMGQEPGVAQGYTTGPVAVVGGKEVSPHRKHSNHMFFGPGYSIAHPGTFPLNPDADEWSMEEWLQFDYRAGWGTERFEELLDDGKIQASFPDVWDNSDDRLDAREIVDANLEKLEAKRQMRHRLMENGSCVEGPIFRRQPRLGKPLNFHYVVKNKNIGHNMPSGSLGAQPQIWLNVALTGPGGQHLWESGYVDRNGDLADMHSLEVAAGRIRPDQQLFNLQTKFLIQNVKGTDREIYLPVNTDLDQLPFIRPSSFPISVMNHPPGIRMEGHSLPPLGTRNATYKVPRNLIQAPGNYRLSVRMRSRAEPIYFMRYCKATPEMERNMNERMLDYHEDHFDFFVAP